MAFSGEINTEFGIALTALSVDTITLFIASSTLKKLQTWKKSRGTTI